MYTSCRSCRRGPRSKSLRASTSSSRLSAASKLDQIRTDQIRVDRWRSSPPGGSIELVSSSDNPRPIPYIYISPLYIFASSSHHPVLFLPRPAVFTISILSFLFLLLECTHLFNCEHLLPYIIFVVLLFLYIMDKASFSASYAYLFVFT